MVEYIRLNGRFLTLDPSRGGCRVADVGPLQGKRMAVQIPQPNQPQNQPRVLEKKKKKKQWPWSWHEKDKLVSGEKESTDTTSGHEERFEVLTQGGYKCQVLQHHITVQASLSLIKETPFLPGKGHSYIFKVHTDLPWWWQMKQQTIHLWRVAVHFPTHLPFDCLSPSPSNSEKQSHPGTLVWLSSHRLTDHYV